MNIQFYNDSDYVQLFFFKSTKGYITPQIYDVSNKLQNLQAKNLKLFLIDENKKNLFI